MMSFFSGPHGAEEEQSSFWANVPEYGDTLPGTLPGDDESSQTSNSAAKELYNQTVTPKAGSRNAAEGRGSLSQTDAGAADEQTDSTDEAENADQKADNETEDELNEDSDEFEDDADVVEEIANPATQASPMDPLGSWTGVPDFVPPDGDEIPTQDQDDL